ncbi:hypothetical protein QBC44DRAFT_308759 [Cladorrhinum sp. PSN332]|nr:hypothetical protein QBC44DRAFT_308759 [Cladorrhinum sp. PSN332]
MILLDSERDAISARISPSCPEEVQRVLTAAWAHDVEAVKKLLDSPEKARCQDPLTLESPLHAAIRSCGPPSEEDDAKDLENAQKAVSELLLWGGIWNDVDDRNETPGCVADRLGRNDLYNLCVEAGVRAEMLFGVLEGYEELESGDEEMGEEEEEEEEEEGEESAHQPNEESEMVVVGEDDAEAPELIEVEQNGVAEDQKTGVDVNSEDYLRSKVTYLDGKLVDDENNGVMMAWETDIMRRSVDALLPGKELGKRILNIGFGMGIIDGMFTETKPAKHHIIEAHPGVLEHISSPESKFGADWEASGPEAGAYKVYQGKWQEVCVQLLQENNVYDAIYFDTFGEDYSQLRMFFTEFIPGLLDSQGVFGFFNGLGADRAICYDVYTKVSELHLADAGLDVEWQVIDVDMSELAKDGEGEWEGVRRRYWTLDKYRLPPSNSSPDSSRKLSFDCEACLTSTLAFLSGISDDPGHVVAVCVEELVGFNGLRVLVAINKKNHESGIGVLKRIEEGLERIFGYLSRANKATEQNAVPVETQVLTAILDMSERRILSRIRSKRFESRYSKKDKWAFSIVVRDVLSVAEKTRGTKRVSPESKSFIDSTTNLAKLLDQLETCPLKDLRDCLKAIVEAASGLTDNTNFDSIFPGATSLQLTAATKLDFISRLKKLARYYECPNFLIQLAKRSGLFEKATIMTVALDAKYFTRCAAGPAGSSLAGCLDRCQSGPSPPFGVKGISRRLGKNQTQANTAFNEAVTEALSESKIHAEVQIVAFYELHPVPRMPRVICSSKDACYLCNQFVKLHGMFHVPRTHGNLYTRWKVPAVPSLSPLRDSFGDSLQGQIRKAIQEFQVDHERKFVFTKHENESSIFPFEQLMSSLDSIPIPPIDSPSKIVTKKAKGKKAKKRSKNAPVPPSHEVEQPKLMPSPPSLAQEQPEQSNTPAGVPETTTKPVSHHPELPDKQQGQPKQILQQLKRLVFLLSCCWRSEPFTIRGKSRTRGHHYTRTSS